MTRFFESFRTHEQTKATNDELVSALMGELKDLGMELAQREIYDMPSIGKEFYSWKGSDAFGDHRHTLGKRLARYACGSDFSEWSW